MASTPDSDAVRRQLHQRLRSLSAAGVDWLPQGPALEVEATTPLFPADEIVEATGSAAPATEDRRIALAQLADEVRLLSGALLDANADRLRRRPGRRRTLFRRRSAGRG